MSIRAFIALIIICAILSAPGQATYAADADPAAPSSNASMPVVPLETHEGRKMVGVALLGVGIVVAATGAVMAIKYNHAIGDCNSRGFDCSVEDSRVPIGLFMIGGGTAMALIGTIVWLQVPKTTTRVAFTPSGAMLAGTF
jgi:hypothetical protein